MADGEHSAAHNVQRPDAQPVLHRTPAYAELRELATRDEPVLMLRQHRDAQFCMRGMHRCDLGAHAPIVPTEV